jgi:cytochrome b561
VLIFGTIPLGFAMQKASGGAKLASYRAHAGIGVLILLLTLGRIVWVATHVAPEPLPVSRGHYWSMKGVHILLYVVLLVIAGSGLAMMALSTLPQVLKGMTATFPNLHTLPVRRLHGAGVRIFAVLLLMHIGGVLRYQIIESDVLARIGVTLFAPSKGNNDRGNISVS